MIRLFVNSTDYTEHIEGLQSLNISIAPDTETGFASIDLSNTFTASDKMYELIYDTFWKDSCNGKDNKIEGVIKVVKSGCNFEFDFEILPDSIDICFESGCAEFQIKRKTDDSSAFDCLKKQLNFWAKTIDPVTQKPISNGFKDYVVGLGRAFKIQYCDDIGVYSYIITYLYQITFSIIGDIVSIICDIIDFFGKEPNFCKEYENFELSLLGCNRYHIAILLKDIFEYNAKLCNLEFDSRLFQYDPVYSCTAIESSVQNDGWRLVDCLDKGRQFNEGNQENWNILQLAKKIQPVFNLYATIRKGKFVVDHKLRRYKDLEYLLNIEDEYRKGNIVECPNYSFDAEKFCAYWKLEYTQDPIDTQGNKMLYDYNEIVEWNENNKHPNNKGACNVNFDFGAQRYGQDEILHESFEARYMAKTRLIGFGFIRDLPDLRHAQILAHGQFSYSKLTIIDKKIFKTCNGCKFSLPVARQTSDVNLGSGATVPVYDYNYPLKGQELYDNFHYIDDPNGKEARYIELQDIVWTPENFCDAITKIFENNLEVNVQSEIFGDTYPEKIDINFENCSITFSGMKYKCAE